MELEEESLLKPRNYINIWNDAELTNFHTNTTSKSIKALRVKDYLFVFLKKTQISYKLTPIM